MPAVEQRQKDHHHGKTEIIVMLGPNDTFEWLSLQLRRRESLNTQFAEEASATACDLKAVTIDQTDGCVLTYQNAAVIDVTDDATAIVDSREGAPRIGRRPNKEFPVRPPKFGPSAFWAVEVMDILPV
ncbi:hypothetical protein FEZ63_07660 [Microvirga brassicacearum]|uniref:Uncharacterized protein n=1 Tax=Microvirga brassicacearum TaxID=2580413 RepID=A0A5N3PBY7_9HYPH|nr:hypothetical protein FEZ63_07660 [Microvirga brassicacearum]